MHKFMIGLTAALAVAGVGLLLAAGALGFSISGAGPSVFALCEGEEIAKKVAESITKVFASIPLNSQAYVSRINQLGVHVVKS